MNAKFFVPFETAKQLKEKGYPQTFAAAYYNTFDDNLILITDRDSASCVVEGNMSKPYYVHLADFYTAAATYHEVLDWLERKGIYISIMYFEIRMSKWTATIDGKVSRVIDNKKTREEALNAIILEALELI